MLCRKAAAVEREIVYIGPHRFKVGDTLIVMTNERVDEHNTRMKKRKYTLKKKYRAHGLWMDQYGIRECFTWYDAYRYKRIQEESRWR